VSLVLIIQASSLVDVNTTTGVNKTKLGNNMVVTCGEPFGRNFICQDQAKLYAAAPTGYQCMLWGMADGYHFTSWSESDNVLGKNLCVACRNAEVAVPFDGWNMYSNDSCHRGAIKKSNQDQYLTCSRTKCRFEDGPPTQEFVENPAYINPVPDSPSNDESRFLIYDLATGLFTKSCLDRKDWDEPESDSRAASCASFGALRWAMNDKLHQLSTDNNNNCLQSDGTIKHCKDGWQLVDFVDPNPAPCIVPPKKVQGQWMYKYMVSAPTTETFTHGMSVKHQESTTSAWKDSLTVSVAGGVELIIEAGPVLGERSVSGSLSWGASRTYANEWSDDVVQTFTETFDESDVGKAVWQFQFAISDSCNHQETAVTKEYALTDSAGQPPCCFPGYAVDAPRYSICTTADAMIGNGTALGCKVNATQHV